MVSGVLQDGSRMERQSGISTRRTASRILVLPALFEPTSAQIFGSSIVSSVIDPKFLIETVLSFTDNHDPSPTGPHARARMPRAVGALP